jgi:hypothetical protein
MPDGTVSKLITISLSLTIDSNKFEPWQIPERIRLMKSLSWESFNDPLRL